MASQFLLSTLAVSIMVLTLPIYAQISPTCTPSLISAFTPCMNFFTNSSRNGTSSSPADCCNSLKSLLTDSKDCFCLMTDGRGVPFNVPINRTSVISLPSACNMPGMPLQCKAFGAPGPTAFGPTMSPKSAPTPASKAPAASRPLSPTLSPVADTTPTPPFPTTGTKVPADNSGNRAGVIPSAARPLLSVSPLLLLAMLGVHSLKYY